MSYDVSLSINTGKTDHVIFDDNFTSNCAPMFELSIGGLPILHGMKASDAWHVIRAGLVHWIAHRSDYLALNPANNWGDAATAFGFLCRIMRACNQHPKAVIRVSY